MEAFDFLGVDLDDEAGSVSPAENAQKYFMPVANFQVVGNSDNSCHNGTDIVYYGAQDDPFAGSQGSVRHSNSLHPKPIGRL